jgi:hypothetical protein
VASRDKLRSYVISLGSGDGKPITVVFEPGAGRVELSGGEVLRMVVSGDEGETVEVTHGPAYISVWPSAQLAISVFDAAGHELPLVGYRRRDS